MTNQPETAWAMRGGARVASRDMRAIDSFSDHHDLMPRPTRHRMPLPVRASLFTATLFIPVALTAQRVEPLFELFATYGRPALAPAVADAYATAGGVRAGGGVGAAAGVRIRAVEVAGFYEIGTASVGRGAPGLPADFTRNTYGARLEVPLVELGREFRGLLSASVFAQNLDSVVVTQPGSPAASVSQRRAPGGRVELGVEHRGFIGTTWFVTGGVAAAGSGSGNWRRLAPERSGVGVAPILTIGLRTREW